KPARKLLPSPSAAPLSAQPRRALPERRGEVSPVQSTPLAVLFGGIGQRWPGLGPMIYQQWGTWGWFVVLVIGFVWLWWTGRYEIRTEGAARPPKEARRQPTYVSMEWQPIETAPEDTAVLVWGEECGTTIAWFVPEFHPDKHFGIKAHWTTGERDNMGDDWGPIHPTHWMPLPAPRAGTEEG